MMYGIRYNYVTTFSPTLIYVRGFKLDIDNMVFV